MPHYKLAFLGFGNVGQALARLLLRKQAEIESRYGITFAVTGIATGSRGLAIDPDGIDLDQALERVREGLSLADLDRSPTSRQHSFDFIEHCGADVLFETIPVNYETGQPAVDLIRRALELGMHVTTANKGPVVHAYQELTTLAASQGRKFYFESTVMDGAPVFGLYRATLPVAQLQAFSGILNSTTNLILSQMEQGESFEGAVRYAQSIGIAETDPSGDIDGWDAAVKVAALVTVLFDQPFKPQQVDRTGIRGITPLEIERARAAGKRWKLVCQAWREGEQVYGKVAPQMVGMESPMYGIDGTTSIVQFESDVLGKLSLIEEHPGPHTTAYGLLADFLNAARDA
ncbi:MAG: homoserine dehydrogenase [Anaerolineales bacterium]|nr:homoserine dehydrogenase [Anaerolineales bacterium]